MNSFDKTDTSILIIGKSDYIENAALLFEEDFTVVRAETGGEAIKACAERAPDIAVSDTMLADITSGALIARLRSCCGAEFPMLFISDEPDDEETVISEGAGDYVSAPFTDRVLRRRTENLLAQARTVRELKESAALDDESHLPSQKSTVSLISRMCGSASGVLMLVSLDDLALVDEIYGDGMRDKLLAYFGERLRESVSQNEIIGRLDNGEYVIASCMRKSIHSINAVTIMLNFLLGKGLEELAGEEIEPVVGASVGAVFFPDEGTDAAEIIAKAEKAILSLKEHEKRGYAVYDSRFEDGILKDDAVNDDLETLEKRLRESDVPHGAFRIGFDALGQVYHYFMRYIDRYCESAFKVLFTLTPKDPDYGSVYELAEYFGELIGRQLRRSDILVHTVQDQFFLILPDVSRENFEMLMERILKPWYSSDYADTIELKYEYKQVVERKVRHH